MLCQIFALKKGKSHVFPLLCARKGLNIFKATLQIKLSWIRQALWIFKKQINYLYTKTVLWARLAVSCYIFPILLHLCQDEILITLLMSLLAKCIKLYSWNQVHESSQTSGITQFMNSRSKSSIQKPAEENTACPAQWNLEQKLRRFSHCSREFPSHRKLPSVFWVITPHIKYLIVLSSASHFSTHRCHLLIPKSTLEFHKEIGY